MTCSQSGCVLFYDENAVTVELWEALPRECAQAQQSADPDCEVCQEWIEERHDLIDSIAQRLNERGAENAERWRKFFDTPQPDLKLTDI
ncbi:MAG: hypothetical protein ACYTG7_24135 [Planctomycetota bacterium]